MKKIIYSAEYKRYNANNRGSDVGDCVKRAISMAFNKDYVEVGRALNAEMKSQRLEHWNVHRVYDKIISAYGGSQERIPQDLEEFPKGIAVTVQQFLDSTVGASGTYILETHHKPGQGMKHGNHLTCSIDGQLFDSWNSLDEYVCGYYVVEASGREFTDITEHIQYLCGRSLECLKQEIEKHRSKLGLSDEVMSYKISNCRNNGDYAFKWPVYIYHRPEGGDSKTYSFKVDYVFTPMTTLQEAEKKVKEVTKVRIYDRFYTIKKEIKEAEEARKLFEEAGYEKKEYSYWMTATEERFLNSLPGWIKPFVEYLRIQNPGQYTDSYVLEIRPLPGDSNKNKVLFEGYDSAMIKEEINRYKNEGYQRLHEDYSWDDI